MLESDGAGLVSRHAAQCLAHLLSNLDKHAMKSACVAVGPVGIAM